MIKPSNPAFSPLFPLPGSTPTGAISRGAGVTAGNSPSPSARADGRPRPDGDHALREPSRYNGRAAEGDAAEAASAAARRSTRPAPVATDAKAAARARDAAASPGGFARAMKQAVAAQAAPPAEPAKPTRRSSEAPADGSGETPAADSPSRVSSSSTSGSTSGSKPDSTAAPDRPLQDPAAAWAAVANQASVPAEKGLAQTYPGSGAAPDAPATGYRGAAGPGDLSSPNGLAALTDTASSSTRLQAGSAAGTAGARGLVGGGTAPDLGRTLAHAAHAVRGAMAAAAATGKAADDPGRNLPLPRPAPEAGQGPETDAVPDANALAAANALQALPAAAGFQAKAAAQAAAPEKALATAEPAGGLQGRATAARGLADGRADSTAAAVLSAGTTPASGPAAVRYAPEGAEDPSATGRAAGARTAGARADKTADDAENGSAEPARGADAASSAAQAQALAAAGAANAAPAGGPGAAESAGRESAITSSRTNTAPGAAATRTGAVGDNNQAAAGTPLAGAAAASLSSPSSTGGNGAGAHNNTGNNTGNNGGNGSSPHTGTPLAASGPDGNTAAAGLAAAGTVGFAGALAQAAGNPAAPAPAPATALVEAPVGSAAFAAEAGYRLSVLVQGGIESAQLQLNPAEMGPVTVQIVLDGSNAQVHLAASDADTRQALEASMPELAGNLREAGLTLTGGGVFEQPNRQPDTPPDAGNNRNRSGPGEGRNAGPGSAASAERGSEPGAGWQRRGMVDLVA